MVENQIYYNKNDLLKDITCNKKIYLSIAFKRYVLLFYHYLLFKFFSADGNMKFALLIFIRSLRSLLFYSIAHKFTHGFHFNANSGSQNKIWKLCVDTLSSTFPVPII